MARENYGRPSGAGAAGGVYSHYGPRSTSEKGGGVQNTGGRKKEIVYKFSYDDLPGGSTDDAVAFIPSGCIPISCYVYATTDFATGTSYDIGLEQSDGSTAIDADGLFDAITLAEINVGSGVGTTILTDDAGHTGTNSGVLLGKPVTADAYLVALNNGTAFTAGEAILILEYYDPS